LVIVVGFGGVSVSYGVVVYGDGSGGIVVVVVGVGVAVGGYGVGGMDSIVARVVVGGGVGCCDAGVVFTVEVTDVIGVVGIA